MNEDGTGANAAWWYLDRHLASGNGDELCLLDDGGALTYRQLHERACRMARVLHEAGVRPGDRVVTVLHDSSDAVACLLAAVRIAAVPVPVSPVLTSAEQRYILEDCGARALVVEKGEHEPAQEAAAEGVTVWSRGPEAGRVRCLADELSGAAPLPGVAPCEGDHPALIQYTSGSTGRPKGVVHLHRGLLALPEGVGAHLGLTSRDRVLSTAKLPFGYGFGNSLLLPFSVGACAVLFSGRAEPLAVAALLRRTRPTVLFAVPTLYAALLSVPGAEDRIDFSSVRLAVSAGEHLGPQLSSRLAETFGLTVVNGLGSTECLHIFIATVPGVSPPGATGVPVPGFEAEVCDDAGRTLEAGGIGRLRVRGPSVADRYWDQPGLTAETFRDGWVYTGDTMTYDPAVGWTYLGRTDNIVNVGGTKVLLSEVEKEILAVPGVGSCAVVGVSDEDDVTRVVAHVVPAPGADRRLEERVQAALRRRLPPFKRPRTLHLVDALPLTSTGKTARFLLRAREKEQES